MRTSVKKITNHAQNQTLQPRIPRAVHLAQGRRRTLTSKGFGAPTASVPKVSSYHLLPAPTACLWLWSLTGGSHPLEQRGQVGGSHGPQELENCMLSRP